MLNRKKTEMYRKDAYKVIYGLIDLYLREGNPEPSCISEETGHRYNEEMCTDLAIVLDAFKEKFKQRMNLNKTFNRLKPKGDKQL